MRARPLLRAEGIEGRLEPEAIYRGVRNAVVNALVGAGDANDDAQHTGLGRAARVALTLLAFAVATIIWEGARFGGIVGAAAFYFPAILTVTLFAPPKVSGPLAREIDAVGLSVNTPAAESISPPPALMVKLRVIVTPVALV